MKTKAMIFTTALLSVIPLKTAEHFKNVPTHSAVKIMQQPEKDILHTKTPDLNELIEAIVKKEEQIAEKTQKIVSQNFDSESAKMLMHDAKEPEDQIYLAEQIKRNNLRKDEKLSAHTLSGLLEHNDPEDKGFILNLITAKQHNNKYYSQETIQGISAVLGRSSYEYSTKQLVNNMVKSGYPDEGFVDILNEIHTSKRYVFIPYKEFATKYELAQKMTKMSKDGSFTPSKQIVEKLSQVNDTE
jgi:hypothetical protein